MPRLPRTVLILSLTSFLTDISSEMIYPLLPAFLAITLGAAPWALGLIEGCAETTSAFLQVYSGRLADRGGKRKPLTLLGYGLSGFARPLIAFASVWPMVLAIRVVDRVGKGLRSAPRDALIADATPQKIRGTAYGFHRAADHAGATLGPLVAALLLATTSLHERGVFLLAAIPGVFAFVALTFVHEPPKVVVKPLPPVVKWQSWPQPFRRLLLATLVFTLGNSTDALLLLKLTKAGVPVAWTAALWALHSLGKMGTSALGGRLSDKLGRKPLMLAGWAVYALVYLGFALADSAAANVALFLAYSLYFGLTEPVEKAWVVDLVPENQRASALGVRQLAVGMGALPASALAGVLWTVSGPLAAFGVGTLFAAVGLGLLATVKVPSPAT
jgi:MFS family permease